MLYTFNSKCLIVKSVVSFSRRVTGESSMSKKQKSSTWRPLVPSSWKGGCSCLRVVCLLGGSPDASVSDDLIVEVKCPWSARTRTVLQATEAKHFFLELDGETGTLKLKQAHNYWHQIQGNMYLTGANSCHLIVWTPLPASAQRPNMGRKYWHPWNILQRSPPAPYFVSAIIWTVHA